jgi:hypothetical protein
VRFLSGDHKLGSGLFRQGKTDDDLGVNVDWFSVDAVWTVYPGLYCALCGTQQRRISANALDAFDSTVSGDHSTQDNRALDVPIPGNFRI